LSLTELFDSTAPSVVAFVSTVRFAPVGQPPKFPHIFGTGFFVSDDGIVATNRHVVEVFDRLPKHPKTGEPLGAAILFLPGTQGRSWQMLRLDIKGWVALASFTSTAEWYGESVPDIGLVQLRVRDVASLKLADEDSYLKVGMDVGTVGYPLGDIPLTATGRLNQVTPFIRHGIVSSVFPFPAKLPHGFTIDIMQQGGSSGSPILSLDGKVAGMMASSVLDWTDAKHEQLGEILRIPQNTNISIAVPAHIIKLSLDEFLKQHPLDLNGVEALETIRKESPEPIGSTGLQWDVLLGNADSKS
jgi:S1-C subfamily serine protease